MTGRNNEDKVLVLTGENKSYFAVSHERAVYLILVQSTKMQHSPTDYSTFLL